MDFNITLKMLLGNIEPYGDSSVDRIRLDNYENYEKALTEIIKELSNARDMKDRPEFSIKKCGERADIILRNTMEELNDMFEREEKQ